MRCQLAAWLIACVRPSPAEGTKFVNPMLGVEEDVQLERE
jgi:hypothetical protein